MFCIVDGVPEFSFTATSMTTLLAVLVESLQGRDWLTLSSCAPILLTLCVCRLVNASRCGSDSSYVIREHAVGLLDKMVHLLQKHTDNVPCKLASCIWCLPFSYLCKFYLSVLTALARGKMYMYSYSDLFGHLQTWQIVSWYSILVTVTAFFLCCFHYSFSAVAESKSLCRMFLLKTLFSAVITWKLLMHVYSLYVVVRRVMLTDMW